MSEIEKDILNEGELLFGGAISSESDVSFAYGTIEEAAKNSEDGTISFGYDSRLNCGSIWMEGRLLSSRIYDIEVVDDYGIASTSTGVALKVINVKYIIDNGQIISKTFQVPNQKLVQVLIEEKFNIIKATSDKIEKYLKNVVKLTPTGGLNVLQKKTDDGYTTYDVSVNIDGETIKTSLSGKLMSVSNTYVLEELDDVADDSAYAKIYKLIETLPNGSKNERGIINIPKERVLKQVHICHAKFIEGVLNGDVWEVLPHYEETNNPSDDLYLHFIWNASGSGNILQEETETFIKVNDIFSPYVGDEFISVVGNKITLKVGELYLKFARQFAESSDFNDVKTAINGLQITVGEIKDSYVKDFVFDSSDSIGSTYSIKVKNKYGEHDRNIYIVDKSSYVRLDASITQNIRKTEDIEETLEWIDIDRDVVLPIDS